MSTPSRRPRSWARTLACGAALGPLLGLGLAACSSDSTAADGTSAETTTADSGTADSATADSATADPTAEAGAFPVELDTASGVVTIAAEPQAIVSLSPTATEMLFAIGAGPQVTAVDSLSTYPAEAPVTDLQAFAPNLEAVAAEEPDLVVLGFGDDTLQAGLADLGVPVLLLPAAVSLDDTYDQIAQLGLATGQIDEAAALNADLRAEVDEIVATVPASAEPVSVYHELDDTFYSASSGSFIGDLYQRLGFVNIADVADPDGAIQYPQLQAEQILEANPDVIVITDVAAYGPDDIGLRPGWETLAAVANGDVVQVDDDIASRWGPRVVEFLRQLAAVRAAVPAGR